jgi:hypothetical protein
MCITSDRHLWCQLQEITYLATGGATSNPPGSSPMPEPRITDSNIPMVPAQAPAQAPAESAAPAADEWTPSWDAPEHVPPLVIGSPSFGPFGAPALPPPVLLPIRYMLHLWCLPTETGLLSYRGCVGCVRVLEGGNGERERERERERETDRQTDRQMTDTFVVWRDEKVG